LKGQQVTVFIAYHERIHHNLKEYINFFVHKCTPDYLSYAFFPISGGGDDSQMWNVATMWCNGSCCYQLVMQTLAFVLVLDWFFGWV